MVDIPAADIQAIIGLGNPGSRFASTRHNVGFMVVDALAERYQGLWHQKDDIALASIRINDHELLLIKPQTFMNASGRVIPFLRRKGIQAHHILVVHDELEKPFGTLSFKRGGSARGHNGLRSLIEATGPDFFRLRFGIGRPEHKEEVPDYVLQRFEQDPSLLAERIEEAVTMIEHLF